MRADRPRHAGRVAPTKSRLPKAAPGRDGKGLGPDVGARVRRVDHDVLAVHHTDVTGRRGRWSPVRRRRRRGRPAPAPHRAPASAWRRTGPAPLGGVPRPPRRRRPAPGPSSRSRRPASRHPRRRACRSGTAPTTPPGHPHSNRPPASACRRRGRRGRVGLGQRQHLGHVATPSGCRRTRRRTGRPRRPRRRRTTAGPRRRRRRSGRTGSAGPPRREGPARRRPRRWPARTASALPPRRCWRRCARRAAFDCPLSDSTVPMAARIVQGSPGHVAAACW